MRQRPIRPGPAQHLWLSDPKHVSGEMDFCREGSEAASGFGWGEAGLPVTDGGDVRAGIAQAIDLQSKLQGRCLFFNPQADKMAM